ncbi:MAG: hypothetical protein KJZ65_08580 [Phycisphaerales bacterium]|nr:hypothetical protein [Phycisphaerales bacterium]
MNLTAGGMLVSFTPAQMPCFVTWSAGVPGPNALNSMVGINVPYIPPFYTLNPILLCSTQVTLMGGTTGVLQVNPSPTEGIDFMLAWWNDYVTGTSVTDSDPGSSLLVTPATVRVIPAPAAALLALAPLAARRRRRP